MQERERQFETRVLPGPSSQAHLEIPFDPDAVWGRKDRHHVTGTVNGQKIRGPLEFVEGAWRLSLGPAWRRGAGITPGDHVTAVLWPEGPQVDSLPPDVAAVLDAEPEARAFFDSLATFYRKGYLRWLEGSARRPAVREQRLREFVGLLKAGKKSREA